MKFNVNRWLNWEIDKPCPYCEIGLLMPTDNFLQTQTQESIEINSIGGGAPSYYIFSLHLICSHCRDVVAVSGTITNHPESWEGEEIQPTITPVFFYPPPKIISVPESCPESVSKLLDVSFGLYWFDVSSCVNKIRIAIEVLLDELEVTKTKTSKNHQTKKILLHERILEFKKISSEVGDLLTAIKWIGNAGSHYSEVTKEDVLDAYIILEHALDLIYTDKKDRILKITKEINENKKPRKQK
ncbi:MAG: DUF4145 domain-containing protein [Saprospiraceae bacterium]